MGYTKETVRGISWIGALRLTTRIVSFIKTAILARILIPAQFGAFGITSIIISLLEVLTETGINVVLVQDKKDIEEYIDSAWIISIIRGFFIGLIIALSASFISEFFNSKDSYVLLLLASIVPIVKGFINPSVVKFQRNLQFDKEFWYRLSIFFVETLTVIASAFITKSAVSFVFGLIAGALFEVFLSFVVVRPHPNFLFKWKVFKFIINKGKWITASASFNYLFQNADNIVVGKFLGSSQLGLYQMGYSISVIPESSISDVVSRVTFPVYIKISKEKTRLKRAFLKTLFSISFLTIPFGLLLFSFPKEILAIFLGEKWIELAPTLRILAIFGIVRTISGFFATLFLAVGKQKYVSIITFVSTLFLIILIVPLVSLYGTVGAAMSAIIGSVASLPFIAYFTLEVFRAHKR